MGATAGGKTSLASKLALEISGEIISADSRQVYKGMNIGTGKDISEYTIENNKIPYHLIDIIDAGEKYNVFEYQSDFLKVYDDILKRNKIPILCGGTGMYIEAVLKGYKMINVPINNDLRIDLEKKSDNELIEILKTVSNLHNVSDTTQRKRTIRAIEIAKYSSEHPEIDFSYPEIKSIIFELIFDRNSRRKRITQRLKERLENGMIEEVENLLKSGVPAEILIYYGLEYKFITEYILKKITYNELFSALEIAIHQFSKRQMTWFRKMEKDGFEIHKIDGYLPLDKKVELILRHL